MPIATPEVYAQMLDRAKQQGFAYPAINVSSTQTLNAALKTLHEVARDLAKSCGKDVELIGKDPEPVSSSWFRPKAAGTAGAVLFNPADVCSWNGAGSS